ncbi:thiamine phosphate synthase [Bacillus sp. V59.32b]|uniref:thiamine phosphate synthase n=1 Tax=Bacillus sp. V59.32b TaxID=1758642 RepID=UPI000E3C5848|nr:thiamine phosphate synthase [Bacillus sp. V59.32b]RFU60056.1 thiamine phosphate synthase [Bacillus sp. V59.32b]
MSRSQPIDWSLYLVTEESVPIDRLLTIVQEAVLGGVTVVQLREKSSNGHVFYEKAARLKRMLDHHSVPLIINDRVDIALAVEAAGVHIGQKDLPLTAVKKIVPEEMAVGVSVQNVEQALEAAYNGADCIGVGAVFPTSTKKDANLLQKGMLEKICGAVAIPAVAIGGITLKNISTISNSGIAGIAVVSEIMKAKDPRKAAEQLRLWK